MLALKQNLAPPHCSASRRAFLKTLAGFALAPSFIPGSVLYLYPRSAQYERARKKPMSYQ